jgi:hypothetical protein
MLPIANESYQLTIRQADQARIDIAEISDDLDRIKAQLARIPTRMEIARLVLLATLMTGAGFVSGDGVAIISGCPRPAGLAHRPWSRACDALWRPMQRVGASYRSPDMRAMRFVAQAVALLIESNTPHDGLNTLPN